MPDSIFVTGGTGYIGSRLIPLLRKRGFEVKALVRGESEKNLPAGATGVIGDALCIKRLQDHVKAAIAPYKYPRAINFLDSLPKTQTGKIQRFKLRQPS